MRSATTIPYVVGLVLATALACNPSRRIAKAFDADPTYAQAFSAIVVRDLATGKTLIERNADKLFTPASNVKLLTAATCLAWLPQDSVPALAYRIDGDTLRLWALAYPDLGANEAPYNERIRNTIATWPGRVELSLHGYRNLPRFGEGWMWDDYPYDFMRERSGLPLYRNVASAYRKPTSAVIDSSAAARREPFDSRPDFLAIRPSGTVRPGRLERVEASNRYYAHPNLPLGDTVTAPIYSANALAAQLLEDWTGRPIPFHNEPLPADWGSRVYNGEPRDSLLRDMLVPSDNFLAEQLLLMAGLYAADLTPPAAIRAKARKDVLGLSDAELAWADASGLSHYNLVTPRAMADLIVQLANAHGLGLLQRILPAGGESGTIRGFYDARQGERPFVFAKTGTLRHNHNLTGLLRADSGRWLAFSMMHNHFRGSAAEYKAAMAKTLVQLAREY